MPPPAGSPHELAESKAPSPFQSPTTVFTNSAAPLGAAAAGQAGGSGAAVVAGAKVGAVVVATATLVVVVAAIDVVVAATDVEVTVAGTVVSAPEMDLESLQAVASSKRAPVNAAAATPRRPLE